MSILGKLRGDKAPEPANESRSQDEIIEAMITRRKQKEGQLNEGQPIANYAELSEEQRRFREGIRAMLKEKAVADRTKNAYRQPHNTSYKTGQWTYFGTKNRSERSSLLPYAVAGIAGFSIWAASVAITTSNYSESDAKEYIEQQGYTNVTGEGSDMLFVNYKGCDGADLVKYSFEAKGANGVDTHVMVCKGLFKAATIRQG